MSKETKLSSQDTLVITKVASSLIVIARDLRNRDETHREDDINALLAGANLLVMMLDQSAAECTCPSCVMLKKYPSPKENN